MTVDEKLVLKLENLARLKLTKEERKVLMMDLNEILGMIGKLQELDTENVDPLLFVNEDHQSVRNDEVLPELSQVEALSNAPEIEDNMFKVPSIIKSMNK